MNARAKSKTNATREAWLLRAVDLMARDLFRKRAQTEVPPLNVSCGFPSRAALSAKSRRIGEAWHPAVAGDGKSQLFIHPSLNDSARVADVLAHEVVHACVPNAKHGPAFRKIALAIGLTGKMTSTVAGPAFAKWVAEVLVPKLGAYPQPEFSPATMTRDKQSTRMIKLECPACGYIVRTTRQWILSVGVPTCGCPDHAEFSIV
jgi:hypothetical protein